MAPVGRYLVVQVCLWVGPVPFGDHDIALDSLRPSRHWRYLAGGDPIGPVGEHRQRALAADLVEGKAHPGSGLPRLNPPIPRGGRRREMSQRRRYLANRPVPELVTGHAAARLQRPHPLGLAFHVRRDAIPFGAGTGELALVRHAQQGKPVSGGVVLRRRTRIRRGDGGEVQRSPRRCTLLG